jgi:hypothetical protein
MDTDIFKGVGVEVELPTQDSFLKIKETLTRIGISSRKEKKLYQSCHILHFKELFILDGKHNTLTEEDISRRNTIVNLLEEWELVKIVDPSKSADPIASLNQIKIISFKEKNEWDLTVKYNIGKKE